MSLKDIYQQIVELENLNPSDRVNKLFTQLVETATSNTNERLSYLQTKKLQKICSEAEYSLEKYWAKKIINSKDPISKLKKFPYYKNYKDLTRLEWLSLEACKTHNNHKVIFIGSGPLPLTAIVLALDFNIRSTLIDIDTNAVELSTKLIKSISLDKMIKIEKADATTYSHYGKYNTFYVAALAGGTIKDKNLIFKKINEEAPKNIHLLARSSWGSRKILYMPLSKQIFKYFKPIVKVDPYNEIVNSVVILSNHE